MLHTSLRHPAIENIRIKFLLKYRERKRTWYGDAGRMRLISLYKAISFCMLHPMTRVLSLISILLYNRLIILVTLSYLSLLSYS